ncbi:MAG: 5-(carboxyamino)imidazole ribonucleotide synthase [Sphingomonadales bacterium]|jgi:5-(carboxyamino)imidazole ribonucleotide synthase
MSSFKSSCTIGIIGGGQLGRMLAASAAQLGARTVIFCPDHAPPAAQVANHHIQAAYDDLDALAELAARIDVATYEFENLPAVALKHLATMVDVFPNVKALEIAQDRLAEKDFLNKTGVATTPYKAVSDRVGLDAAVLEVGLPAVLKTRRFGYDGKGQMMIRKAEDVAIAWEALRSAPGGLILEGLVDFEREISVITARTQDGSIKTYDPVWNTHENHILSVSRVPAGVNHTTQKNAEAQAAQLIAALDYVGVLTIEFFVLKDGQLLANEIAPRVHNSGHWTIEGAVTSQFENHIRAVMGWPLGDTTGLGEIEMRNLIGRDIDDIPEIAKDGQAHIHLYGKGAARLGRKMGHVTWVRP